MVASQSTCTNSPGTTAADAVRCGHRDGSGHTNATANERAVFEPIHPMPISSPWRALTAPIMK